MWVTLIGSICGLLITFAWSLFYPIMNTHEFWLMGVKCIMFTFTGIGFICCLYYWYKKKALLIGLTGVIMVPVFSKGAVFFGTNWSKYDDIFLVYAPYWLLMIVCIVGMCGSAVVTFMAVTLSENNTSKTEKAFVEESILDNNTKQQIDRMFKSINVVNQKDLFTKIRKRHKVKFKSKIIKKPNIVSKKVQ